MTTHKHPVLSFCCCCYWGWSVCLSNDMQVTIVQASWGMRFGHTQKIWEIPVRLLEAQTCQPMPINGLPHLLPIMSPHRIWWRCWLESELLRGPLDHFFLGATVWSVGLSNAAGVAFGSRFVRFGTPSMIAPFSGKLCEWKMDVICTPLIGYCTRFAPKTFTTY